MYAYAFFIVSVNKFLVRVNLTLFDSQIQVLKYSNHHYCNNCKIATIAKLQIAKLSYAMDGDYANK